LADQAVHGVQVLLAEDAVAERLLERPAPQPLGEPGRPRVGAGDRRGQHEVARRVQHAATLPTGGRGGKGPSPAGRAGIESGAKIGGSIMTPRRPVPIVLATILLLSLAMSQPVLPAPAGPPIRVGSTLALTGPLAATALVHKIVGDIYVQELNKKNGLLGR